MDTTTRNATAELVIGRPWHWMHVSQCTACGLAGGDLLDWQTMIHAPAAGQCGARITGIASLPWDREITEFWAERGLPVRHIDSAESVALHHPAGWPATAGDRQCAGCQLPVPAAEAVRVRVLGDPIWVTTDTIRGAGYWAEPLPVEAAAHPACAVGLA